MSVSDLRKELLKLQKEFLGGKSISKLHKHEVYHRIESMKKVLGAKSETPEPEPMKPISTGAPKAREISIEKKAIAEDVEVSVPKAPKGGKQSAPKHSKRDDPKVKATPKESKPPKVAEPAPEAAPASEKKPRRVPPKVVLDEGPAEKIELVSEEPVRKKVIKKKTKPAETAEPGPESPAPVAAAAAKLPGGCRPIADA